MQKHNFIFLKNQFKKNRVDINGFHINTLIYLFYILGCTGSRTGTILSESEVLSSKTPCEINSISTSPCTVNQSGVVVTDNFGSNITQWGNPNSSNTISAIIPSGYYPPNSYVVIFSEPNLISENIISGKSIFNVAGTAQPYISTAHRDKSVIQISAQTETTIYAGKPLPVGYRESSDLTKDDDGFISPGVSSSEVTFALRPDKDCGTTQTSIAERIAHCLAINSDKAIWDGTQKANAGQGVWKLVTRKGVNKEVWQDQRTGLLWSSIVTSSAGDNWCRAAGNGQTKKNDGTNDVDQNNICNNSIYQSNYVDNDTPFIVQSWCVEQGPVSLQPADPSENWDSTPSYSDAKGGMGFKSTTTSPSVRWRLPNKYDYQQADIDGIRFVLPDILPTNDEELFEWTATIYGNNISYAHFFSQKLGSVTVDTNIDHNEKQSLRSLNHRSRCVGRGI